MYDGETEANHYWINIAQARGYQMQLTVFYSNRTYKECCGCLDWLHRKTLLPKGKYYYTMRETLENI